MLDTIGYVLLGIILLMAPGFLFSLILYPKLGDFDFWVRVGMSLALGALAATYIGFGIAKAGALELGPFVAVDLALCVGFLVVVYFRGGFGVIMTYMRAVLGFFRRFGVMKPPKRPAQQPEQLKERPPEEPKEQPPEQPPAQPPEKSGGS